MLVLETHGLEETLALGRRLGALVFPGAVIGLEGTLGTGKTNLVRGIAEGLGIPDSRMVSSPTFVLVQEYAARLPIYHFDTYRLRTLQDFLDLGVAEYFAGEGVCVIEWADKVTAAFPPEHLWIRLEVIGEGERRLSLSARGEKYERLVATLTTGDSGMELAHPSAI